jgi:LacI family transcriptional regulator
LHLGSDIHLVAKQTSGLFDQIRPRVETIYEDLAAAGATMGRLLLRRIAEQPQVSELQVLHSI